MATTGECNHGVSIAVACWDCYADGIELEDGKYHFHYDDSEHVLRCRRHGEPWRNFVGDNAVRMLFFAALDNKRRSVKS